MGKTLKDRPSFKKTKKKKGPFWGEASKKKFQEELLKEEK